MSMHLVGPWLSTNGKKKGKSKFRNSDSAAKAKQNVEGWNELLKKHGISPQPKRKPKSNNTTIYNPPKPTYRGYNDPKIPSLNPTLAGDCTKPQPKVYTGDKIVGIGVMHKSNSVPIFSDQEAKDIAHMRR